MQPALRVDNVFKAFSKPAVEGLSLTVAAGEFYALLGPNGAGKTTTLRIIAGLTAPDFGSVDIFGVNVQQEPERAKQTLAYVPDDPPLYGKLSLSPACGVFPLSAPLSAPRNCCASSVCGRTPSSAAKSFLVA